MARLAAPFIVLAPCLVPAGASAHAVERGLIQLLPTGYYLAGGAAAVAVTALVMALVPARALARLGAASVPMPGVPERVVRALQWFGFAVFAVLVAIGYLGPHDPLANLLPLSFWILCWIGLTVVAALFGDVWASLNPWSAPARLVRNRLGLPESEMPGWVGYWPALVSLGLIFWFDLVSLAPEDPGGLATVVLAYWVVHLSAMAAFGEAWRRRGEGLSVFFGLIALIGPCARGRLHWPGAGLIRAAALPVSGWLVAALMIAGVTADGLFGTFWWLDLIGINPLEFPGRSAVIEENTVGLITVWIAMTAAFAGAVLLGRALAGGGFAAGQAFGRLAFSLLPIALAYHVSHFLIFFLINGQYTLEALSDPLGTGADWLGLGAHFVTTSFLNTLAGITAIWRAQVAIIVGGHLMAVLVAHAIMLDLAGSHRRALVAGAPLAGLMVGYTVLGLWLMSTPTGA